MIDFKSPVDALGHVEEVAVIDLLQHVMALDDRYIQALQPPEEGIYLLGSFEPLLCSSQPYYYRSQLAVFGNGRKKDIYDFESSPTIPDITKIGKVIDDIIDQNGKVVITAKELKTKSKYFRTEPTVPSTGLKMAVAMVQRYLGTLCRHTSHIHFNTRMEALVKEEHQELIDSDEFMVAFERLLDQVANFVGKDHWNIYFYKVKGTSIVITKGIDWRVFRYYELTLPDPDAYQE